MIMMYDKDREALEGLMKEAERYASLQMRGEGHCPPRLYMDGIEGRAVFRPPDLSSEQAKDNFATLAKLVCIAHGADAAVFVSEAWMIKAKQDQALDLNQAPSESPDRQEVVIIMGETREGHMQKFLPILRHENGKFKSFGESPALAENKIQGRFAQFVPLEVPDEETRQKAKSVLQGIIQKSKREERERDRGISL